MAAVARYLNNVLVNGISAMIAAILRLTCGTAITHRVLTFPFVCHNLPPFLVNFSSLHRQVHLGRVILWISAGNQIITPISAAGYSKVLSVDSPNQLRLCGNRGRLNILITKLYRIPCPWAWIKRGAAGFLKRSDQSPPFSAGANDILMSPSNWMWYATPFAGTDISSSVSPVEFAKPTLAK